VPFNSVDSRLEPLGNTFLNYEDMMLLLTKQRIFRAHSFAGYRPWRLREKTLEPDSDQPGQQHHHPSQTQHLPTSERSLPELLHPANAATDNKMAHNTLGNATPHSSSVGGSVQGEAGTGNHDEDVNTEFGAKSKTDAESGNTGHQSHKSRGAQAVHSSPCTIVHHVTGDPVTTLVIQRLPRDILVAELLQEIDASGFSSLYDFCYVPCQNKPLKNLGFAFLNFLSPESAWKFQECWQGTYHWDMKATRPGIGIAVANAQGKQANLQRCYPRMSRVRDKRFHPFVSHSPMATSNDLPTTMGDRDHDIPLFKEREGNQQRT